MMSKAYHDVDFLNVTAPGENYFPYFFTAVTMRLYSSVITKSDSSVYACLYLPISIYIFLATYVPISTYIFLATYVPISNYLFLFFVNLYLNLIAADPGSVIGLVYLAIVTTGL